MLIDIFNELELTCDKFAHYFPLYEQYFSKFVGKAPRILEIGVQFGGSAEMWRKYFGAGTMVFGVDIHPACQETDYLRLIVGDQGSHEFWKKTFPDIQGVFDIVIDDGSHENRHQIVTLVNTFRLVKDGGLFWCEDTHTSYYHKVRVEDGGYKNPNSFTEFCKDLIDVINYKHAEYAIGVGAFSGPRPSPLLVSHFEAIKGVHFYDSVVVIEKGDRPPFQRIIHKPPPLWNVADAAR